MHRRERRTERDSLRYLPAVPDLHADPRFVRFTLRTDCPRCGAHLPINGPAPAADCAECGHRIRLPDQVLRRLLESAEESWPRVDRAGRITREDMTWRWTAEPLEAPACTACGEALDPAATQEIVTCNACGQTCGCLPLEGPGRFGVPTARRVYGGHTDLRRPALAPRPIALACPQCGGGLSIGVDRARITPCDYCNTPIHLPDVVWRQLHPPREVQPWILRFEGPNPRAQQRLRAREAREKRQAMEAQKAAEKARKEAERAEARKRQEAASRARRAELEAAQRRQRERAGRAAVGAWLLTLVALLGVGGFVLAHALGLFVQLPVAGRWAAIASTFIPLLLAWGAAIAAAAWHGRLPVLGSLGHAALHLVLLMLPVLGVGVAAWLLYAYGTGRQPTPGGKAHEDHRHALWVSWPGALLAVGIAVFASVAASALTGATLWEMLGWFAED